MQQYGIDGVLLQRFVADLKDRSVDQVLDNIQKSVNRTGRVFAVGYDLTGTPKEVASKLVEKLKFEARVI